MLEPVLDLFPYAVARSENWGDPLVNQIIERAPFYKQIQVRYPENYAGRSLSIRC